MDTTTLFEVKNIAPRVLEHINLRIEAKMCLGLSGPSGSGKTLLLRQLADLDPRQGDVLLDGLSIDQIPAHEWRRQVALLPAESQWWFDRVGPHFWRVDEEKLKHVGFDRDVMNWEISRLSSGEKQRLALLRLLQNRPRVLLLDEPTANLDPTFVGRVEQLLLDYKNKQQAALVWVGHDRAQLQRIADVIYEIRGRELVGVPHV